MNNIYKTFKKQAAQGDLLIKLVDVLPDGLSKQNAVNGVYVVAHSETGHNHIIAAVESVEYYASNDPMVSYLKVIESCDEVEVFLKHLRSFDTHAPIKINPGIYEVRRQREYTPNGWRRVED